MRCYGDCLCGRDYAHGIVIISTQISRWTNSNYMNVQLKSIAAS